MSLCIDDRIVTGVYALNQWFDVLPGSISIDAYEFSYYQEHVPFGQEDFYSKLQDVYPLGDMYKDLTKGKMGTGAYGRCDNGCITFCPPSPYDGFSFKSKLTNETIAFPITEIKAFKYDTTLYESNKSQENKRNKRKQIKSSIRAAVIKRDKSTCQMCGATAPEIQIHIDHIKALANGGTNDIENLQVLCSDCNLGKGIN